MSRSTHHAIVVGAGVGGLSAAIALAGQGIRVTVLERAARAGGKLREVPVGETRIDGGPTVFTMRWVFEELFDVAGLSLTDEIDLIPAKVLARHAWNAEERLDLFADLDRSADAIGSLCGRADAAAYRAFCKRAGAHHDALKGPFMTASRPDMVSLLGRVGISGLPGLLSVSPFQSLWSALGKQFSDPRLRQLFARYSTYMGSSPFQAPATLMLIAHVEQTGVWYVKGGMYRLTEALVRAAERLGVTVRCDADVTRINVTGGRTSGIELANGERIEADAVVVNGDAAAVGAGLFGADTADTVAPVKPRERSLSALAWTLEARAEGFPLVRHSVFFNRDYADEFGAIFKRGEISAEPTVYVCAQDRLDGDSAPDGPERMLILVNAPADGDKTDYDERMRDQCTRQMMAQLSRCGLQLATEPARTVLTTPKEFAALFPATGGALYGRASHGWQASFKRPDARTKLPGLYLAGGSIHPGAGVPMAALSGRLAAASLLSDCVSTTP